MRRAVTLTAVTAVAAITAATLTFTGNGDGDDFFPVGPFGTGPTAAGGLFDTYESCDALAQDLAGRSALQGGFGFFGEPEMMAMDGAMAEESADVSSGGATSSTTAQAAAPVAPTVDGTSDTNVAVAGIDEPDLVETDGRRLFSVVNGEGLLVADVTTPTPTVLARVPLDDLGWSQLLLVGDRLLVVGQIFDDIFAGRGGVSADMIGPASGATRLAVFDVSGDVPQRIAQTDVEGQLITARAIGSTVHLVSQSFPAPLPAEAVDAAMRTGDPQAALAAQLARVPGEDFLPRVQSAAGTTRMACDAVSFVPGTRDAALLSIHTFDVNRNDLAPVGRSAIVSDGQNVTATADRLVVATTVWPDQGFGVPLPLVDGPAPEPMQVDPDDTVDQTLVSDGPSTLLHLFQIDAGGAAHLASGQVPGFLVNQFAMSWFDGHLRVATTLENWNTGESVSQLAVLRPEGEDLVQVGFVGKLGPTETIRSVRYLGDAAYVVTFRQTDPLYAIDLRNPAAPVVTGELKITGFSSYLHPLGDGLLLGIGQEATEDGRTTGLQVQIFDVSNPATPLRTSQIVLEGANSQAEFDHLAVTVHEGRLFLPYARYGFTDFLIDEVPAEEPPAPEEQPADEVAPPVTPTEGGEFIVENGELILVQPGEDVPAMTAPVEPLPSQPFFEEDVELGVIVVDVTGDQLTEVARLQMDTQNGDPYGGEIQRVVVVQGNAVLVGWQQIDVYDPTLRLLGSIR